MEHISINDYQERKQDYLKKQAPRGQGLAWLVEKYIEVDGDKEKLYNLYKDYKEHFGGIDVTERGYRREVRRVVEVLAAYGAQVNNN